MRFFFGPVSLSRQTAGWTIIPSICVTATTAGRTTPDPAGLFLRFIRSRFRSLTKANSLACANEREWRRQQALNADVQAMSAALIFLRLMSDMAVKACSSIWLCRVAALASAPLLLLSASAASMRTI